MQKKEKKLDIIKQMDRIQEDHSREKRKTVKKILKIYTTLERQRYR